MSTHEARPSDRAEQVVLVGLLLAGVVQMLAHPVKLYGLVVHRRGWYDA